MVNRLLLSIKIASRYLRSRDILIPSDVPYGSAQIYLMDIKKDRFVHFTLEDRIPEILASGKLMFNPPYEKFGIEEVAAISIVWGKYLPGVQTTHTEKKGKLGAILFETNTIPKVGYSEEVLWGRDVVFTRATRLSANKARSKVVRAPFRNIVDGADIVMYV